MAVQTIGFDDKQFLNQNSDIADVNKVNDTDMNEIKSVVNNNAQEVENMQNAGQYVSKSFTSVSCTRNSSNNLATITLPKGRWVVTGYFYYNGNSLRYLAALTSTNGQEVSSSCYDNSGIVTGNLTTIVINNSDEEFNITLTLWPTDKDITVGGNIKAIKYQ